MIGLIVAMTVDGVIGINGKIPWNIPGEQAQFRELTLGNAVIMGKNSFSEIYKKLGGPLPGRLNIVISSDPNCFPIEKSVLYRVEPSIEKALESIDPRQDIFIAGGAMVYNKVIEMDIIDRIYITTIDEPDIHINNDDNVTRVIFDKLDEYDLISRGAFEGPGFKFTRHIFFKKNKEDTNDTNKCSI